MALVGDAFESDEDFMEKFQKLSTDLKALTEQSLNLETETLKSLKAMSDE
jgi:hypothetical protein